MDSQASSARLLCFLILSGVVSDLAATEVCSNTILPGSKGDDGAAGDEGDQGRQGKTGPPGQPGLAGEMGSQGDPGQMGKTGPAGERGNKGDAGARGPAGLIGKTGTTCDCGRYRKLVGQMEINVDKLKNTVKFVKNVVLGIKETEEKLYLLVREPRTFQQALVNCRKRGGVLAMPKSPDTNSLLAAYISQAGLARVFVGLQTVEQEGVGVAAFADRSPVQDYSAWAQGEPRGGAANSSCVEMSGTGTWSQVLCEASMFYVCEFARNRTVPATPLQ
ncbi:collectin-10 [Denticeps clupeoides]|uniref:collectin-10 n=1 Tax=Denticeps clupeoides TaxID=299321 RepID=UPI0010A43ACB|nr:collectin-10 [Denticeps clupeoides]